ncbi:Phosphoribosylanthranilate isomerase [plant metagenome]|uniref:phosphoribosylanthranilate isomerase n=1 Tax=plant metagenome TaxID=1297885 RepID=A0A484U4D7_9ZZZZ
MRTRIKICGLTREDDLLAAADAGADALGMVFYAGSKRCVDVAQAARLRRLAPSFVSVVALFVNPSPDDVQRVLDEVGPDLLQFHGDETPEACERYGHPYLRAFRVGGPTLQTQDDIAQACEQYAGAQGWLFDSYSSGYGGSGLAFDHTLLNGVPAAKRRAVVLSGGLKAGNVEAAAMHVRPWAVDVSSGVESAPGIKSALRIQEFVAAVHAADARLTALAG